MAENNTQLPPGAGATASTTKEQGFVGASAAAPASSNEKSLIASGTSEMRTSPQSGTFQQDEHESGYRASSRAVIVAERPATPRARIFAGAALVGLVAGGAYLFSKRGQHRSERALVEETITIDRPAREIYDFWRDFTNLPQFMDNIKSVEKLGDKRSHWTIKAPAGTSVEFDSIVVEDVPGKIIAWESERDASVPNRGRVEFSAAGAGATLVRVTISYDPPAGAAGRLVAKLFQREPGTQARQDLARLKQLLEGGGAPK